MPMPRDPNGHVVQAAQIGTLHSVAVGAVSQQSNLFTTNTNLIRVCSTVDCFVAFGVSAVATSGSMYLPAGAVEYFAVNPGGRIAVLRAFVDGAISLAECI